MPKRKVQTRERRYANATTAQEVEVHAKEKGSDQREKVCERYDGRSRFMPKRKVQTRERRYANATTAQLVVDVVRKILATK
jgi:hypothetical protein